MKEVVDVLSIVITVMVAFVCGYALDKLHMPGGMMIGAVIGACLLGVFSGYASMPMPTKIAAQIIAGAYIGAGVSREELREMRTILKPALIVLPGLLCINLVAGFLIHWTSPLDLITAFMSCAPGGLSDIPIIAADLGADTSKVLVMQFIRFLMGIALFPSLIRLVTRAEPIEQESAARLTRPSRSTMRPVLLTLAVATAAGLVGYFSSLPSGTMALAVLGSVAFKSVYPKAQLSRPFRKAAQCLSGAFVGAGIGMRQLVEIPYLVLPIALLLVCYTLGAFCISLLLVKAKCFTRREAMLAATPAGASDIALISTDLGVHNVKLILLQVLRLMVVLSVFPAILSAMAGIFG